MGPLGRKQPPDWGHVDKFPLRALEAIPTHVPVVIGVNWYEGFDTPEKDAAPHGDSFWIGRNIPMGGIRGGHCVCLEPAVESSVRGGEQDAKPWWEYYDQGQEGACVGFGCSRAMSLLNRHRYDANWLYDEARKLDGTYPADDGTYVRSGFEVLREQGHRITHLDGSEDKPKGKEGIAAYRWCVNVDEVLEALGTPHLDHVTILNSWGASWPHRVKMPANTLDRLIREAGEAGVVTDR